MRGRSLILIGTFVSMPTGSLLQGQTVAGLVVDALTKRVVPNAAVILIDDAGRIHGGVVTDSNGFYSLRASRAGPYRLRVDAEVYTTLVSPPFELDAEETVDIELRIARQEATRLATATVTGEKQPFTHGPLRGFYEREKRGWGRFLTREDIRAKKPVRFSDALRLVPGIRVIRMPRKPGRPLTGSIQYTVRVAGASLRALGGDCVPTLYLDGVKLGRIDDVSDGRGPDLLVHPNDLEGIEVYRPAVVPAEFGGTDAMCGVIVVWTLRSP